MTRALPLLLAFATHAQDSQFQFDPNGNLFVQTAATSALPQITGQPQNRAVPTGEATSFSVVVADTRALAYQWQFKGTNISGATNDALLLRNVSASDEGEYQVVLTNPLGSVTSAPARLWIDSDADGLPDSWELAFFGNLTKNPTADFDGDGVSNLAEFLDGTSPTDRSSARFQLTVLRDGDGIVEASPLSGSYTNGEAVTLTATPSGTNLFYGWTGNLQSTNNPLSLVVSNNITVRAHFQFLPVDIIWTNKAGGDWQSPVNWSPNRVPGALDNAILPITAAVSISDPAECLGLTLGSVSGTPTLTGSGTLTVRRNLLWTLGTMSGSGRTILDANVMANIPAAVTLAGRTLENRGRVLVYNTGTLNVMGGAVVTNCAGAQFQFVNEAPFLGGGLANGRFDNAGTVTKSSGIGTLTVNSGLSFNNYGVISLRSGTFLCSGGITNLGTIDVSSGTAFRVAGGGSATGTFVVPQGAIVEWTGGTFTLNPGAQLLGDGLYRINAGTVAVSSNATVENLDLATGALGGTGVLTVLREMNWTGGGMNGGGRTIVSSDAVLNAALPSGGALNARTLENDGTVLWTGAANIGFVNATITNRAGALFHAMGAGGMAFVSGLNRFDNAGTFRKSVNAGMLEISGGGSFNNSATLEIQKGTFLCGARFTNDGAILLSTATTNRFSGGGSSSGVFSVPAGALLEWSGGTFSLNEGAQLEGAGTFRINGISATVVGSGDVTVPNLDLVNGSSTLSGTGTLSIAGVMNWTAGTMNGGGRTFISPGATLFLANSNSMGLQRTLENAGTVIWSGSGTIGLLNGVITNRADGLFRVQNAGRLFFAGGASRFDNAGTFTRADNTGTTFIDPGLPFNNVGKVDIQSGILAVQGGYNSTSNAVLNFGLGGTIPGTGHGRLQVSGNVNLNGALSVELSNGFVPALNDSFTLLAAGSRNGAFNGFLFPSNGVMMTLSNTPTSVIVRVTDLVSPPVLTPTLAVQFLNGELRICWSADSNVTYQVEFTADLSSPHWLPVPGSPSSTGDTICFTDSRSSTNRFYRVRVLP